MDNRCLVTLIQTFRENDMSVFPTIFAEFEGLLYYYAARSTAEDTFEELSVFLLELLYKLDISKFKAKEGDGLNRYIAVCIGNKYIALCKEEARIKKRNAFFEDIYSETQDFTHNQILKDALSLLTQKQREIILSKYIYNYRDTEIAYSLGISRQAVNRIKNRGMEKLREYFK